MKKLSLALLTSAIALVLVMPTAAAQERPKLELTCPAVPTLMQRYLGSHVSFKKADDKLVERVVDLYVERVDPTRALLTAAQEKSLRKEVRALYKGVESGRCEKLNALHAKQVKWHKAMEDWARKTLARPVKIDRSIELQMDPDKRKRPKNKRQQNALRKKLLHFQLANYVKAGTKLPEAQKKLVHRYELITRRVKEQGQIDLFSTFLNAYANALDPHSTYFSPEDLEDFRISMDLALEGIGAVLSSRDGYTVVQEVVPGGAAARHGKLKAKDKIIAVSQGTDGEPVDVIDMDLSDVVRLIRGKKGTDVKLTVLRQAEGTQRHEFLITRDKIDLKEQAAKLRWEEVERDGETLKLAVLDLPSFYGGGRDPGARDCTNDVRKLLQEVNKEGADGLVLDLSRNGGGLLQAAVDISGFFIARGPVVSVDGPATPTQVLSDRDPRVLYNGPLVVLTSRTSASASEILAGALQDYKRAVIVGDDHTFGKGTVQNIVPLPPGFGALKVTTSLFFLPGGRSTQADGVSADINVPSIFSAMDFGEKNQPYALPTRTVKPFTSSDVQHSSPTYAWTPVSDKQIKKLASASKRRVKKSKAFDEVLEEANKLKKNDGVIKLADILDDPKSTDDDDKDKDKDKLSPQAEEALEILADLARAQKGSRVGKK